MSLTFLVTLQEARDHLRIDDVDSNGGPDASWLNLWIPVFSRAVARYLKDSWRLYEPELDANGDPVLDSAGDPIPEVDSNGDETLKPEVRGAVLIALEDAYRNRGGEGEHKVDKDFGYGYSLPKAAIGLLYSLRMPALR